MPIFCSFVYNWVMFFRWMSCSDDDFWCRIMAQSVAPWTWNREWPGISKSRIPHHRHDFLSLCSVLLFVHNRHFSLYTVERNRYMWGPAPHTPEVYRFDFRRGRKPPAYHPAGQQFDWGQLLFAHVKRRCQDGIAPRKPATALMSVLTVALSSGSGKACAVYRILRACASPESRQTYEKLDLSSLISVQASLCPARLIKIQNCLI